MTDLLLTRLSAYPEFLTAQHLVELGFYKTTEGAYIARRKGNAPNFVKIGGKILYPKGLIVEFIEKRIRGGSNSSHTAVSNTYESTKLSA
jgi:hypothetical protein